ncbi:MAG: sporulation transcriptional regulator SpoIIID [Clostridia bacterium]|nr:sporulation transcriptional regulator SpoIIID [Clostridia bacterium]
MLTDEEYRYERCELIAEHIISTGATVRAAALKFGISKSTVHKDITERLEKTNPAIFIKVKKVLEQNKAERHLRGGEATKQKYRKLKNRE